MQCPTDQELTEAAFERVKDIAQAYLAGQAKEHMVARDFASAIVAALELAGLYE